MNRRNAHIFQHWKFAVYVSNGFLRHMRPFSKADPAHAIAVPEGKYDSLIVCWVAMFSASEVIDNDGKWRRMRQHIFYRCSMCAKETKTEVGWGPKHEVSPSSANVRELVPPTFAVPMQPPYDAFTVVIVLIQKRRPIETKDIEKGIIIESIDSAMLDQGCLLKT